jgi:hypothetical protein
MLTALAFEREIAGRIMLANIAIIAITTSNSMSVKPAWNLALRRAPRGQAPRGMSTVRRRLTLVAVIGQ